MSKKSESMIAKVLKASKLKNVAKLNQSILLEPYEQTVTHVPAINIALSGKIDGGIHYGFQQIAGPSKHFKSSFGLIMISSYLKQHDDAICLFYDGEFGTNMTYFENFGIDLDRVFHIPFMNIEELKFDIMAQLNELNRDDKVIIFIDSIGNAASKKEVDDTLAEKSTADMSRAKQLASLGRMITPLLGTKRIPCIAINHTYKTQDLFSKDVVSGGTKILYSSNTVWIVGREKVKEGGFIFNIKIEKSRFLEEGQKIPISVCDRGIGQWTGLDQMALEFGIVTSCKGPRNKNAIKYESKEHGPIIVTEDVVDFEEGEKLWTAVLKETNFKQMIEDKYTLRWSGTSQQSEMVEED